MAKRFGIKTAPEGCGHEGDGACESCIMRASRRGRWAVRQLLPLAYRTRYHTFSGWTDEGEEIFDRQWFVVWRMWFGRCFSVERVEIANEAAAA
jgi:hypothetical protein